MDSDHKEILYMDRARNELDLANTVFNISINNNLKLQLELKEDSTFFSNVIGLSYYSIFYAAKAILHTKGINTKAPEEHKKTLKAFEKLTKSGIIDLELLKIYKSMVIKAEELLNIFSKEKFKRGTFTYKKLPMANKLPANESLNNAEKFYKNILLLLK